MTEARFQRLEKDNCEIKDSLDRIEKAIVGDEKFGIIGIVNTVKNHDKYIQNDKIRRAKQTGLASLIAAISASITAWLTIKH